MRCLVCGLHIDDGEFGDGTVYTECPLCPNHPALVDGEDTCYHCLALMVPDEVNGFHAEVCPLCGCGFVFEPSETKSKYCEPFIQFISLIEDELGPEEIARIRLELSDD